MTPSIGSALKTCYVYRVYCKNNSAEMYIYIYIYIYITFVFVTLETRVLTVVLLID